MVIALAGRRIDALGSPEPHFPLENVSLVRRRLREFFARHKISALVCSAACGADLLALDAAREFAIARHIVLPPDAQRFRETSVTDRPGDWGPLYDHILAEVGAQQTIVISTANQDDGEAYEAVNEAVLKRAAALARQLGERALAVLVWNGISRADGDLTQRFADEARARGFGVIEISTRDSV